MACFELFLLYFILHVSDTTVRRELDYLEVYQDIVTPSAAIDVELFHLPGEGLFAVFANSDSGSEGEQGVSGLYRWLDNTFRPYQRLPSVSAQSWCHFNIDSNVSEQNVITAVSNCISLCRVRTLS